MSDTSYNLWCLVEGENTPFLVTAPSNILIGRLKERIQETIKTGIRAHKLELWKVRCFLVICSDIMGPHYP